LNQNRQFRPYVSTELAAALSPTARSDQYWHSRVSGDVSVSRNPTQQQLPFAGILQQVQAQL
jgi:hypothetical protein